MFLIVAQCYQDAFIRIVGIVSKETGAAWVEN